jgi:polysaccharide biosynthesis protein PslH
MKVLFLTCHLPYPPLSGGRRREYELLKRLSTNVEIVLCCITKTFDKDVANISAITQYCTRALVFPAIEADSSTRQRTDDAAFEYSEQMARHTSMAACLKIPALLADGIDVVHVESYYLMHNLPDGITQPVLLASQNIEYTLAMQRLSRSTGGNQRRRLKEYINSRFWEQRAWGRAAMCVYLTEEDLSHAGDLRHACMIPNGCDHPLGEAVGEDDEAPPVIPSPSVLFVGNFAYRPTAEAALLLIEKIFPRVLEEVPDTHLLIVGNDPGHKLIAHGHRRNVTITGAVTSLEPFYRNADVFACPLQTGGGVKVKMIEALRTGSAIVTTSVGAQGFGKNFESIAAVRDDVESFSAEVVRIIREPLLKDRMRRTAKQFSECLPTWRQVSEEFTERYRELAMDTSCVK